MKQLTHFDLQNKKQQFPITIVCDAIRTPQNIGMCFRIAESFGVSMIYFHENSPNVENHNVRRSARNTIYQTQHAIYKNFKEIIQELKKEGNTIIGLEITDKSIDIQEFNFNNHEKLVLLVGSERKGIKNTTLLDYALSIPMYGRNSSMNVTHCLSIALYEATNQIKSSKVI